MMKKQGWFMVVVVSIIFLTIPSIGFVTRQASERLDRADMTQCERGNFVRAWIRWDARLNAGSPELRAGVADDLFPILDCGATQAQGRNVPLSDAGQIAFIEQRVGKLRSSGK